MRLLTCAIVGDFVFVCLSPFVSFFFICQQLHRKKTQKLVVFSSFYSVKVKLNLIESVNAVLIFNDEHYRD